MSESKSNPVMGNFYIRTLVGSALMVGGYWFSSTQHLAFIEKLGEQGIPFDPGKTIAAIGVFIILFPVLKFFFFAPLADSILNRTTELERTFSEAESLRTEMASMRSEYEQRLAATEASAREQIQAQIKEAQSVRTQLMAEATAKADEFVVKAREEIEMEKNKVMSEVRLHVANLTLGATERILGQNVDNDTNRRLVQEFIDKVEVPG